MSKTVQLAGGTADTESEFVGADRELRVDTSNAELRIHNGVNPGGARIPNLDYLLDAFQEKSAELDGFQFAVAGKGFLVRTAPGVYALRKFMYSTDDFTVSNPAGLAGDVQIQLKATIATAHTWSAAQTFDGGIVGNLTGDVEGNVTGDVTGDVTGKHTGDADFRGKTVQFDENQIPVTIIDNLEDYIKSKAWRVGDIKMWGGSQADIEPGWQICDGTNGTPNMSGRAPFGIGGGITAGATGGSATHTHTGSTNSAGSHGHNVTVTSHQLVEAEIPQHHHQLLADIQTGVNDTGYPTTLNQIAGRTENGNSGSAYLAGAGIPATLARSSDVGGNSGHGHDGSYTDQAGTHSHNVTTDAGGALPPYCGVIFIMKVA